MNFPVARSLLIAYENNIIWNINYFFALPREVDYIFHSPSVFWEDAIWRLRLMPNGLSSVAPRGLMFLELERQHTQIRDQIHDMQVRICIMGHDGDVLDDIDLSHVFHDRNRFCRGFLASVDRATAESQDRQPSYTVSFWCILRYSGATDIQAKTLLCHEMVPRVTGLITVIPAEDAVNIFRWNIEYFLALPKQVNSYLDSQAVLWEDASWCLRISPNGVSSPLSSDMFLGLERLCAQNQHQVHRMRVILRIMRYDGSVLGEISRSHIFHDQDAFCGGFLESVDRSRAETERSLPNLVVSISCTLEDFGSAYIDETASPFLKMEPDETILRAISENTFRWEIPNFRELQKELDFSIKSRPFRWENSTWCLRLYPNGIFAGRTRWMTLQLVRMHSLCQDDSRRVHVIFRILRRNDDVLKEVGVFKAFKSCGLCEVVLEYVDRSIAERNRRAPDFVVPFLCILEYSGTNDSAAGTSQYHELEPRLKAVCDNVFSWDIPNFTALSDDPYYCLRSRKFVWGNATWYLRLHPNGEFALPPTCIFLELVRENSGNEDNTNFVQVTFRIMKSNGDVLMEVTQHKVFTSFNNKYCRGYLESIYRSTAEMEKRPPNFVVSFSCTLEPFMWSSA